MLIALQGPLEGKKWEIKDALSIGRDPTCDIFIDDRVLDRVTSGSLTDKERLRRRIRSIDTVEFGKYFLE